MIVLFNQSVGPLYISYIKATRQVSSDEIVLVTGTRFLQGAPEGVQVHKACTYDNSSPARRISTWIYFILQSLYFLTKNRKCIKDVDITTNPPFIASFIYFWLIFIRVNAKCHITIYDLYPEVLFDNQLLGKDGLFGRFLTWFDSVAISATDRLFVLTPAMSKYILQRDLSNIKPEILPLTGSRIAKMDLKQQILLREQYTLPLDKKIIIYTGNFGINHSVDLLVEMLESLSKLSDEYIIFLVGRGEKAHLAKKFVEQNANCARYMDFMADDDFSALLDVATVGLVSLSPAGENLMFPSKVLTYSIHGVAVFGLCSESSYLSKYLKESGYGETSDFGSAQTTAYNLLDCAGRCSLSFIEAIQCKAGSQMRDSQLVRFIKGTVND